MSYATEFEF